MKFALLVLALAVLPQEKGAPRPSNGKGGATGSFEAELKVGDQVRLFRLAVPERLEASAPVPLVFAFHGYRDSKEFIRHYSGFEDLALKDGFIAAFPAGLERRWELRAADDNRDLLFFDALLDFITSRYNVDLRRVYATGMSMGGYFSNLLASKRSDRVAAIAPHSGGLGVLSALGIRAKRKYPVFIVHGDADRIVKVDEGRTSRDAYLKEGHSVEYVEVKGMGHAWGGRENITERIWKFFLAHPMP